MKTSLKNTLCQILQRLGVISDWVVEQGTSGIWTYRKWNSGIAECWGTKQGSVPSGWSNAGIAISYPFTFMNIEAVSVQQQNYQIERCYLGSQTMSGATIQTKSDGALTLYFRVYIIGLWKSFSGGVLRNSVIATLSAISKIGGGVNEGCHKETVIKGADESAGTVVSSHAAKRRQPEQSYRILGNGSVLYTNRREQFTSRMGNAAGDWRHRYFTDNIQCERYICTHVHGKPVDLECVEEVCSGKLATSERRCAA